MRRMTYRGYILYFNERTGLRWVEKNGRFIGWIRSIAEGQDVIDKLIMKEGRMYGQETHF